MSYSIQILRRAQKELAQLPKQEYELNKEALLGLSERQGRTAARN